MSKSLVATILIIEDEPGVALLQRRALERAGFRIQSASSPEEAFVCLDSQSIDLIVLDFYLSPDVTGLEVYHQLKSMGYDLPVILVTGRSAESLVIEALRAGVRDFVVKSPEYLEYLPHAVQRVLTQVQLERQLRQTEEQIRQMQKLDSIGQFAAGIAHDFNNIVTVQQGFADLLLQDPELPPRFQNYVQQIAEASQRAAKLTRQLLLFSRKQALQPQQLDLNAVVRDVNQLLTRILGEHIELELDCDPQLPSLWADLGMVEQVLMNLASNARDAMVGGGNLKISTFTREISQAAARTIPEAHAGKFLCLRVSDTGSGIDPEIVSHIFEPLFTTKEADRGTGLGLATVLGIVKQHQGWIEVETESGKGTSFQVYFPVVSEEDREVDPPDRNQWQVPIPGLWETAASLSAVPPLADAFGSATSNLAVSGDGVSETIDSKHPEQILVVEDEASLRQMVVAVLRHRGYRVLSASSGVEALEVWGVHRGAIHLVITDMVMPEGMTGRDLAERLWQDKPALKVIFTSGYSVEISGLEDLTPSRAIFFQKPYTPRQLAETVRSLLQQPTE
jgi:two-component system, cell cycle sensor histidine kinase and response regulator CckA